MLAGIEPKYILVIMIIPLLLLLELCYHLNGMEVIAAAILVSKEITILIIGEPTYLNLNMLDEFVFI